jgi:hypothetical protein
MTKITYKFKISLICAWFLVSLIFTSVKAKTDFFDINQSFINEQSFVTLKEAREAISIYHNPASLLDSKTNQVQCSISNDFFDYSRFTVSGVYRIGNGCLGLGYSSFFCNDIFSVEKQLGSRPEIRGTLEHNLQNLMLGYAIEVRKKLKLALKAAYRQQKLAQEMLSCLMVDIGVQIDVSQGYWLGMFTKNLLGTDPVWKDSKRYEEIKKIMVLEQGFRWEKGEVCVDTDFTHYRIGNSLKLTENLAILTEIMGWKEIKKYGLGVKLELDGLVIVYGRNTYLIEPDNYFDDSIAFVLNI